MRQPLKDLAAICAGQGAPQGDHNYCENGTPFVKAGNLQELLEGKAITSIQKVSDEVAKKHKLRLYPKGTILFAKSGMSCMKGYIYVLPQSAYVVSHLACITPNEDISEYLRYYFNYDKPNQLVKDAAYPSISLSDVGNLVVDMKPESERNEIVSVLQHTESIITLRQQQLQKLNELVKARFVEMFSSCQHIASMNELCSIITDGTHQPPKFQDNGIPFIFVSNLVNNTVTYNAEKFISEETYGELYKRTPIEIGDLLLSTVGSYGHVAVVVEDKKFLFQRHIAYLKPKHEIVNSFYLHAALLSPDGQRQIEEKVKGIAQKTLNLSEIKTILIPLPSIEEQKNFEVFVKQVDKSKVAIQKALVEAQLLFDSLMQKYFG